MPRLCVREYCPALGILRLLCQNRLSAPRRRKVEDGQLAASGRREGANAGLGSESLAYQAILSRVITLVSFINSLAKRLSASDILTPSQLFQETKNATRG